MDISNHSGINGPKQIFILSGQSNMAGLGGVDRIRNHWDGVVPPECSSDPSRIFRLNLHRQWEVACVPLHFDIDTRDLTNGVGPGMTFANAVKSHFDAVGLVPCAMGGSAMKDWTRGTDLYNEMVNRAKASLDCGGELKALLWYQGESDTFFEHDVVVFKERIESVIRGVRSDLGVPFLPVIQVAIASGYGKYFEKIREIQKGIEMANLVTVDAKGLPLEVDNLHLTTEAQVRLGRMLAEAYTTNFL